MDQDFTAVVFTSQRSGHDEEGYRAAVRQMDDLVSSQPGYLGYRSVRDQAGLGITVSYWESPDAAHAWKQVHAHLETQRRGRDVWYSWYRVDVASVQRHYESVESPPTTSIPMEEP